MQTERRKTKNLKQLCYGVLDYRQGKRKLKELYPEYSATTQVNYNKYTSEYEIECGSEFAKKILKRTQVRLIEFHDSNYDKYHDLLKGWNQHLTHYFTFAPIQPAPSNKIEEPISVSKLRHHARCVFDYLVEKCDSNVFMVVRIEANKNKAQADAQGYHIHAVALAKDMCNPWSEQSKIIKQITKNNFGAHFGPYSHYMVPYDSEYGQFGRTGLQYCHKPPEDENQEPSINYILIK